MSENYAIGIDIGGTNTAYGLVSREGKTIFSHGLKTATYASFEEFTDDLASKVQSMINRVGNEQVAGVGVGAPNGNFYTGEIVNAANLAWKGFLPIAKVLQQKLQKKIVVTNDANAAAVGEMKYGVAKKMKDFLMLTLGTGVGSGFVANGRLVYGHDGFAGELGHVIAVRDGRSCGCGRNGCMETYCSATGLVRTAKEWLDTTNAETVLRKEEKLSAYAIQKAALNGDYLALELYDFTAKILGQTLADAVAITSPQAIVFFGGLAHAGDILLYPTRKYFEDNLLSLYKNKVAFHLSALMNDNAGILGASALVWE
jgi:glucokinase